MCTWYTENLIRGGGVVVDRRRRIVDPGLDYRPFTSNGTVARDVTDRRWIIDAQRTGGGPRNLQHGHDHDQRTQPQPNAKGGNRSACPGPDWGPET